MNRNNIFIIICLIFIISCNNKKPDKENAILVVDKLLEQGQYEKSISILDSVLIYYPNDIGILLERSFANSSLGKDQLSINDLNKVIISDSTNQLAFYNRSLNHFYLKHFDRSLEDVNRAISLKGGTPCLDRRISRRKQLLRSSQLLRHSKLEFRGVFEVLPVIETF